MISEEMRAIYMHLMNIKTNGRFSGLNFYTRYKVDCVKCGKNIFGLVYYFESSMMTEGLFRRADWQIKVGDKKCKVARIFVLSSQQPEEISRYDTKFDYIASMVDGIQ